MHEAIAEQAARLMPVSLQRVMAAHLSELKRGAVAPLALAGQETLYLHPDGKFGTLDEVTFKQTQRILDLLAKRSPLANVAYEMGVLSNLVAAAQDPVNVAASDPREAEWSADFERYTAQRVHRFAVVFNGYLSPQLAKDDVRGFVQSMAERTRNHYPILSESYVLADGGIAKSSTFDERHPVFGVASLSYSHSIGDTAKLWLYIWIRSDGDTTGLPFPDAFSDAEAGQ